MEKSNPRHVTLNDVAQLAGVSSQTVSRVVNNHPYVSEDTRRRVQNAIRQLGYRPNRAARSLVTQRSCMLGLIGFGLVHYGPAQMFNNIERTARSKGYGVSFSTIKAVSAEELNRAVEDIGERAVDGLVFILPEQGVEYDTLVDICSGIPFVQIDSALAAESPSVVIDQYLGSQLATQHLIDLGHTQLCEISGPLTWYGAQARHHSWLNTVKHAGLTPGRSVEGDWTSRGGYKAVQRLLAEQAEFTGLVVGNDQMALGAIRALRENGLLVPDDISVVGFDDVPEAAYYEPPLTTVQQNFAALGDQGVDYLISLIEHPDTPIHQRILYPQFIQRKSTRRL